MEIVLGGNAGSVRQRNFLEIFTEYLESVGKRKVAGKHIVTAAHYSPVAGNAAVICVFVRHPFHYYVVCGVKITRGTQIVAHIAATRGRGNVKSVRSALRFVEIELFAGNERGVFRFVGRLYGFQHKCMGD